MLPSDQTEFELGLLFSQLGEQGDLWGILQALADGVLVQDESRKIVFANQAAARLMGCSTVTELVKQNVVELLNKFEIFDETGKLFDLISLPAVLVLKGAESDTKTVIWKNKITGQVRISEIKAKSVRDKNGVVKFAVSLFRDITDQRRVQEEFERSLRRNQHILESITDGFFALDRDWNFTYINKQAEILLGKSREELLGKNIFEIFPSAAESETHSRLKDALLIGQPLRYEEFFGHGKIWIESSVYPAKDGLAVYLRDITLQKQSEEANAKLAAIVESSEDAIIGKTLDGTITSWNKGAEEIYGYTSEEIMGKNIQVLTAPGFDDLDQILETLKSGNSLEHYVSRRKKKNGQVIVVSLTISPIRNKNGELVAASTVARDITAQQSAEEMLRKSEERFRAMIENTSDAIILVNEQGIVTYASSTLEKVLGYRESEVIGTNVFNLVHPEDVPKTSDLFLELLATKGYTVTAEYRGLHKNGNYRWMEGVGTNLLHVESIGAIVANFRDITERKLVEETLRYQYHHDSLTDLPNRTYLNEKVSQALEEAATNPRVLGLMLLDLDRFKQINESLGHALGDRLIQEVGLRIQSCLPNNQSVARLGGDEFGILLDQINNEEDAAKLSNKILEEFKPAFYLDSHEIYISPSIGVSLYPYDGRESATLFKNAETALYRAKDHGRNTYQFYTTAMNSAAYERLTMESKLRRAIDNQEFVVFYQPQIDVRTGKIVGTEELIRWQKPDMTLILPERFIPLAEANGLIEQIGEFVLIQSLKQGKIWHDMGFRMVMAVNLSARQFKQKNFEHNLIKIIEDSGFDPKFLELELTESVLAENEQIVTNIMHALRERGVRFCLDDFSTGYSSLRYIKQFPVDMLKIERNFLKGIPMDIQNSAIAKSIITLGQSLGMEVTAEGVESKTQLAFLRDNLCNRAQGYLFNGAMPAHSLTEILGEDRYVSVVNTLSRF
jgi:diguanylate cyclase (GGDEF)-like protein/PAS domain S-box-containing protein